MDLPLTWFDFSVFAVIGLSAIVSFARGFVRETLSIAAFIVAALAAVWAYEPLQPAVTRLIDPDFLGEFLIVMAVFLLVYVAVTILTSSLSTLIRESGRVNFIDRVLGLIFGVARGLLLSALALIFINVVFGEEKPEGVETAATYEVVESVANLLALALPESARIGANLLPSVNPEDT